MNSLGNAGILWFLPGILILSACQNGGSAKEVTNIPLSSYNTEASKGAVISFDTTTINFGKVYEGERVGSSFKFKNSGDADLVLLNVTSSCGCTIPSYSNEPVAPGEEGQIKIVFNSKGREGMNFKTINVESNAIRDEIELVIIAEVIRK